MAVADDGDFKRRARKAAYDRVQQLVTANLPLVFLASPHVLAAGDRNLGNFEPAVIDPVLLWNADRLFWQTPKVMKRSKARSRSRVGDRALEQPAVQHDEHVASLPARDTDSLDGRLVRECLEGDEDGLVGALARYKRLIYSIPVKYGLSADEATDVFQDVCVELLAELPRLRDPRALPKWLIQVTSHKCVHLKRLTNRHCFDRRSVRRGRSTSPIPLTSRAGSARGRARTGLRDAVSALSPRCRQLIQMLFFETPARPYQEIARQFNLANGSIGFIRGRCLGRLRNELHRNGFR